jgi:hypothetical protein
LIRRSNLSSILIIQLNQMNRHTAAAVGMVTDQLNIVLSTTEAAGNGKQPDNQNVPIQCSSPSVDD